VIAEEDFRYWAKPSPAGANSGTRVPLSQSPASRKRAWRGDSGRRFPLLGETKPRRGE